MNAISRTLSYTVALVACLTAAATAQPAPTRFAATDGLEPLPVYRAAYTGGSMPDMDFTRMEAAWWRDLDRLYAGALDGSEKQERERAMQGIIYYATSYPEQSDFDRAAPALLDIYIRSDDEGHRILALSALHAIGNDAAMRHLAQYVKVDRSARVQQLTKKVLADYFGTK